jgi:antiviral helicase SLH1
LIWAEDHSGLNILQLTRVSVGQHTEPLTLRFIIPISDPPPPFVTIRAISDRWVGAEQEISVSFERLVVPIPPVQRTPLLDLPLLRTNMKIMDQRTHKAFSRFTQFNSIQTQCFWPIYNTERNVLVSSSSSSGKSILGQIAIW